MWRLVSSCQLLEEMAASALALYKSGYPLEALLIT
jgi:hypothetical protein